RDEDPGAQQALHRARPDAEAAEDAGERVAALEALLAHVGGRLRKPRLLEVDGHRLADERARRRQVRIARGRDGGECGDDAEQAEQAGERCAPESGAASRHGVPRGFMDGLEFLEFQKPAQSSKARPGRKPNMSPIAQAIQTIRRGAEELIVEEELAKKLSSGRKLRVKLGLD